MCMKLVKIVLPLTVVLFSCSKEIPFTPQDVAPRISFEVAGIPYNYTQGLSGYKMRPFNMPQFYGASVFIMQSSVFDLFIVSDTLIVGQIYPAGTGSRIQANNSWYTIKQGGDNWNVKIISYNNSVLNATFVGKLSNWNLQRDTITNGLIRNLKIDF